MEVLGPKIRPFAGAIITLNFFAVSPFLALVLNKFKIQIILKTYKTIYNVFIHIAPTKMEKDTTYSFQIFSFP